MYCGVPTLVVPETKGKFLSRGELSTRNWAPFVSPQATCPGEIATDPNLHFTGMMTSGTLVVTFVDQGSVPTMVKGWFVPRNVKLLDHMGTLLPAAAAARACSGLPRRMQGTFVCPALASPIH